MTDTPPQTAVLKSITSGWFNEIASDSAIARLVESLREGGFVSARGSSGSSTLLLTAAIGARIARPILLVVAHLDQADEAVDQLDGLGISAAKLPGLELLPGETNVSLELLAERLMVVERVLEGELPQVIVAPIQALMQPVPDAARLPRLLRTFESGDLVDSTELAHWLTEAGYHRVQTLESPGEFAIRGDIIDLFPPGGAPSRLDLFGDEIESISEVDLATMGSDRRVERLAVVGATLASLQADAHNVPFASLLPESAIAVLDEMIEIVEQGRSYYDRATGAHGVFGPPAVFKSINERCHAVLDVNQFTSGVAPDRCITLPVSNLPTFAEDAAASLGELAELARNHRVVMFCQNDGESQRFGELIAEFARDSAIEIAKAYLHRGLIWRIGESDDGVAVQPPLALVPYHEFLHRFQARRRIRRLATGRAMDNFLEIQPGDYVVHRDHGIARFAGLRSMNSATSDTPEEFLTLEFARGAKLHVPASKIELVQKYVGAMAGTPELSTFGGRKWANQKEKVSEAVRDLAAEMLQIQAARESVPGIRFPADTTWQREFEAEFPFEETEDQLSAITSVKKDMAGARPMDRLICGDVGFGKTEVAIRAAFKSAEYGKQVAVLVPTTVLAEQHERTFRDRFAGYPFIIESLSRFKTAKQQKEVLQRLSKGQVDIVIGTHRLLSKDVRFADLGLVIIDEEQRFGVEHKQRLLQFRLTADVITLSATPIPRTLHMALLGLRDITSLTTAPMDRMAIVTEVSGYNPRRIQQAIQRELAREGQIFFVHNRIHNIQSIADDIQKLVPDARIIIGHGQMPAKQLEDVMLRFMRRQADILVSTTIIESGIDIPTANTMFINDAQRFGLSELHQLRGRVGRYKHRAYCYMLVPEDHVITEIATKRLQAIENYSMLGAGFKIALRDLEIRGAGNLLGAEQSGHISAVGYEMYCQLLERAVGDLRNERPIASVDTTLDIGIAGSIPRGYIPSDVRRMDAYRRISSASDLESLERVRHDLVTAYGELPRSGDRLLQLAELRIAAAHLGIRSITRKDGDLVFRSERPRDLETVMQGIQGSLRAVGPIEKTGLVEVYYRPPAAFFEADTLLAVLRRRLVRSTERINKSTA